MKLLNSDKVVDVPQIVKQIIEEQKESNNKKTNQYIYSNRLEVV